MWKTLAAVLVVAWVGYSFYDYYTEPFDDAPRLNEGYFLLAFGGENGLKGVMRGVGDKDSTRTYIAYGATTFPTWHRDTWSICRPLTEVEATKFLSKVNIGPRERLEAICEVDVVDEILVRGWIASRPVL